MCVCVCFFGNTEKCLQQEIFLADMCLTFMFTDCECVYMCVHAYTFVCVSVGLSAFISRGIRTFDTSLQLLRARAFSCCRSDSSQKNLRVCACGGTETFSAGSGSGIRERWIGECQVLLCVCEGGTILENHTGSLR